jgi:hypothetical protein
MYFSYELTFSGWYHAATTCDPPPKAARAPRLGKIHVVLFTVAAIAGFSVLAVPSFSHQEVTLEDTLTWMHDFTVSRPPVSSHGSYSASVKTSDKWIFASNGCSASITDSLESWDTAGNDHTVSHETHKTKFSLKDLDPRTIDVTDGFPAVANAHGVFVTTFNEKNVVSLFSEGTSVRKVNRVEIDFAARSDAERFARAFRHVVIFCGDKPTAF